MSKTAALQQAQDDFEATRVALIERVEGEQRAEQESLDALRVEKNRLIARRYAHDLNPKEGAQINARLGEVNAAIPRHENAIMAMSARLNAIRTGNAPELLAAATRMRAAERDARLRETEAMEAAYRESITAESREAAAALVKMVGERPARKVILEAHGLSDE